MNSVSFGKEIYGAGWIKYINGELNIIQLDKLDKFCKFGKFDLPKEMEKGISYFIKKEYHLTFNGYTSSRYEWVECEFGVIMELNLNLNLK